MRWALIRGGIVLTVVERGSPPTVEGFDAVELEAGSMVGPGWRWDGNAFSNPPGNPSITAKDFWRRFTASEREALQNVLATGTQVQKNRLNAFRDYVMTGGNVELNDDYIVTALTVMENAGIIANGRAAQILAY